MKKLILSFIAITFCLSVFGQTTHDVCVSEIQASGTSCVHTATFTPANLNIAVGDKIKFTTFMIMIGGYPGTNHMIRFNGSSPYDVSLPISSNITAPFTDVTTVAFNTPGVYSMECTNSNHCLLASFACQGYSVTVGTTTEIEEERLKNQIRVYPNPSSGIININLLPVQDKNPKVYIMDVLGKTVETMESLNTGKLTVDASSYEKGIYFVKIETDNGTVIKKVIIE